MKILIAICLALSILTFGFSVDAENNNKVFLQSEETAGLKNKLSRHVYIIGPDSKHPNDVLRYEHDSFPLRPEFTVAIDGEIVKYGKYKPVSNLGHGAIPLLQTLKFANIPFEKKENFYVFSHNGVTFKVPYDGSDKIEIHRKNNVRETLHSYSDAVENEIFVDPRVLQTVFFNGEDKTGTGLTFDDRAYFDRAKVLNLYAHIDPNKDIIKANEARKKVFDSLAHELFTEIRMPENEKEVLKAKAEEITIGITNDYQKVKAIHKWVATYLAYDNDVLGGNYEYVKKIPTTGESNAYVALELKQGMCGEYATLANQLLKAIGIPSRMVMFEGGSHIWVDAFVENRWVSFDPTWDTSDAIINGKRVENHFQTRNKDNTFFFDFDYTDRATHTNLDYLFDANGTHEDADTSVYANWYWDSPLAIYDDFEANEYWSTNMMWAIEKKLINGYLDVKNPNTGEIESLIKPYNQLSESQFLTIMFRYMYPDELNSTKPSTDFWASTLYQMAEKYNLPTKGLLKNQSPAGKVIKRGTMAEILATLHFKRKVTSSEAVQFMYDSGLSNGYPNVNGEYPKTYESFGPNDELKRAHIVTFVKRYDDYVMLNN